MLHTRNVIVRFRELLVRVSFAIAEVLVFGDPLGVNSVESPNLPPPFATDNVFQIVRTKPVDKKVSCLVTRGKRYLDWCDCGPWRGRYMRVCAVDTSWI